MTASTNEAVAIMRAAMDAALAAPKGVRRVFLDDECGPGRVACERHVKAWRQRMYGARSAMRRANARISGQERGMPVEDPDTLRTAYDSLFCDISRNEDDTGWVLTIMRADMSSLGFEAF